MNIIKQWKSAIKEQEQVVLRQQFNETHIDDQFQALTSAKDTEHFTSYNLLSNIIFTQGATESIADVHQPTSIKHPSEVALDIKIKLAIAQCNR